MHEEPTTVSLPAGSVGPIRVEIPTTVQFRPEVSTVMPDGGVAVPEKTGVVLPYVWAPETATSTEASVTVTVPGA